MSSGASRRTLTMKNRNEKRRDTQELMLRTVPYAMCVQCGVRCGRVCAVWCVLCILLKRANTDVVTLPFPPRSHHVDRYILDRFITATFFPTTTTSIHYAHLEPNADGTDEEH